MQLNIFIRFAEWIEISTKPILSIIIIAFSITASSLSAIPDSEHPDSVSLKKIKTIGIVEPFVFKNIPAIKNVIVTTMKEKLANHFNYMFFKNDSILNALEDNNEQYVIELFQQKEKYDALMIVYYTISEVDYKNLVTIDRIYESKIQIYLINRNGEIIGKSEETTNKEYGQPFKLSVNHNAFKILKKVTSRATNSIMAQMDAMKTSAI